MERDPFLTYARQAMGLPPLDSLEEDQRRPALRLTFAPSFFHPVELNLLTRGGAGHAAELQLVDLDLPLFELFDAFRNQEPPPRQAPPFTERRVLPDWVSATLEKSTADVDPWRLGDHPSTGCDGMTVSLAAWCPERGYHVSSAWQPGPQRGAGHKALADALLEAAGRCLKVHLSRELLQRIRSSLR